MTKTNKAGWTVLAAMALTLGMGDIAHALDPISSNNTITFIIRIQPNVDLGVSVDTSGAGWIDGGNLDTNSDLAATNSLVTGVRLQVIGNFDNQEWELSAAGNDTWTLDSDATPNQDALQLYAMIGADQSVAPAASVYETPAVTTHLVTTTLQLAGQAVVDEGGNINHLHEFVTGAAPQYADIDGMATSTFRRLWLRADTPPQTTTDLEQSFTITVTAKTGVGQ